MYTLIIIIWFLLVFPKARTLTLGKTECNHRISVLYNAVVYRYIYIHTACLAAHFVTAVVFQFVRKQNPRRRIIITKRKPHLCSSNPFSIYPPSKSSYFNPSYYYYTHAHTHTQIHVYIFLYIKHMYILYDTML